jgi:hypothetical protein
MTDMIEDMLEIAVDPLFPAPYSLKINTNYAQVPEDILKDNKFQLIFD